MRTAAECDLLQPYFALFLGMVTQTMGISFSSLKTDRTLTQAQQPLASELSHLRHFLAKYPLSFTVAEPFSFMYSRLTY